MNFSESVTALRSAQSVKNTVDWGYPGDRRATFAEFFADIHGKSDEEIIKRCREYADQGKDYAHAIRVVFECIYHPQIVFDLPPGAPNVDYGPRAPDAAAANLFLRVRKLGYFIKDNPQCLTNRMKREQVFLDMLASMSDGDARVLIAMKDKDWKWVGIRPSLAKRVFPGWLPDLTDPVEVAEDSFRNEVPAQDVVIPTPKKAGRPKGSKNKPKE